MIRGKVALGGLSLEFGNAQQHFDELAHRVQELSERHAALITRERELIEQLARLYLPELSPVAVSSGLRELEDLMARALVEQRGLREKLAAELEAAPAEIGRLEHALEVAEADEARTAATLAEVRSALEDRLSADDSYGSLVEEHTAVMERRALLNERRARLHAAANIERARYEEHLPFAYLQRRGYGGPEYGRGPVATFCDRWLARRTGYAEMARKYRILRTGPHVIQAEIRRLTDRGRELEAQIDAVEQAASEACGLDAVLAAETRTQNGVATARQALTAARERRDAIAAEAREVEANRGGPYETAIQLHTDFLKGRTVQELLHTARSTPDPRDEALVDRVDATRTELEGVNRELATRRTELERLAGRTESVADLVRSATERFSSRRSHFSEGLGMGELVRSILDGTTEAGDALETLAASHMAQPVIQPGQTGPWQGWFAELSSHLDREFSATTRQRTNDVSVETEVVVRDANGRIVQRRITRRRGPGES